MNIFDDVRYDILSVFFERDTLAKGHFKKQDNILLAEYR